MNQETSILKINILYFIGFSLLFIFLSTLKAYAQFQGVEEGDRVRVTAPAIESGKIKGTVSSISSTMLMISDRDTTFFISHEAIRKLEISSGKKRNTGKGAIIGAISGGVILGIFSVATNEKCEEGEWCFIEWSDAEAFGFGTLIGALGGGLNGAIIGTLIKTDRWKDVPIGVSLRPVQSSNFDFTMEPVISVRFKF